MLKNAVQRGRVHHPRIDIPVLPSQVSPKVKVQTPVLFVVCKEVQVAKMQVYAVHALPGALFVAYGQAFCENTLGLRVLASPLVNNTHDDLREFQHAMPGAFPGKKRRGLLRLGKQALRRLPVVDKAKKRDDLLHQRVAAIAQELRPRLAKRIQSSRSVSLEVLLKAQNVERVPQRERRSVLLPQQRELVDEKLHEVLPRGKEAHVAAGNEPDDAPLIVGRHDRVGQYPLEVLPRLLQVAAPVEEYAPDHQITELPHGIVDGTMLEIAAVASRANELVLAGQRDELADDKGNATSSPPSI